MSLHHQDWAKLGIGAVLAALTYGLGSAAMGAGAGASGAAAEGGAGAAGAGVGEAAGMGAGEAAAAGAGGLAGSELGATGAMGAAAPAASGAAGQAGLGHALMSLGMDSGKDAAKAALVRGIMSAGTQQKANIYGQPLQMMQQPDAMSLFPRQ